MDAMTDLGNLLAVIHGDGGHYLRRRIDSGRRYDRRVRGG